MKLSKMGLLFLFGIFLLALLSFGVYRWHLWSNLDNIGNKIDFACSIYLRSRGDLQQFTQLMYSYGMNTNSYPPEIYLPTTIALQSKPIYIPQYKEMVQKLNQLERGGLWEAPILEKQLLAPYVQGILHKLFETYISTTNNTDGFNCKDLDYTNMLAIHLRLSDVPFVKHNSYHLRTLKWYIEAVECALTKNPMINQINIISCHQYCSRSPLHVEISGQIVDCIRQGLQSHFPSLQIQNMCNNKYIDMYIMYHASVLIAAPSSFAYYVGIASYNHFITTSRFYSSSKTIAAEHNQSNSCSSSFPIMKPEMYIIPDRPILHENVISYENFPLVKQLLLAN